MINFKSHQGSCFYADDNEEFIPSFCGTSNHSCETSLRTDDYQFSCEDQIVPSSEQENTLGEKATYNCFSQKWQQNITQDSTSQKTIHNSVKTYAILIR